MLGSMSFLDKKFSTFYHDIFANTVNYSLRHTENTSTLLVSWYSCIYIPLTQKYNQWILSKERHIKNTIYIGAENKAFSSLLAVFP